MADFLNGLTPSVGLEIHVRLKTPTKLFCGCRQDAHARVNSLICPVCMGLPGSLPALSQDAVACGIRLALALGARVEPVNRFDRKHYFYPDLPRNYQITQWDSPLAVGGAWTAAGLTVPLERLHLEEDAGRLLTGPDPDMVAVDLNRAGTPLLEIVSLPFRADGAAVRRWLRDLQRLVRWLEVGDGNLEDGSLRCDANVGFLAGSDPADPRGGPWTELKNLNSPGAVQRAVDFEIARLTARAAAGEKLDRETRGWDATAGRTRLLRRKEATRDYRFLPEPDLPLVRVAEGIVTSMREALPELPSAREARFRSRYGLEPDAAATLCRDRTFSRYFEDVCAGLSVAGCDRFDLAAGWLLTEIAGRWDSSGSEPFAVDPGRLADLLVLLADGRVSGPGAKRLFAALLADPQAAPEDLLVTLGLERSDDAAELSAWCRDAVVGAPEAVASWRGGKFGALDFLVGRVMALSRGRAEPAAAREVLRELLEQD